MLILKHKTIYKHNRLFFLFLFFAWYVKWAVIKLNFFFLSSSSSTSLMLIVSFLLFILRSQFWRKKVQENLCINQDFCLRLCLDQKKWNEKFIHKEKNVQVDGNCEVEITFWYNMRCSQKIKNVSSQKEKNDWI